MGRAYFAKLPRWGGIVVLAISLVVPAVAVQAGESEIEGRNVYRSVKAEWTEIGDVEGHVIGFWESNGLGFEESDVATIKSWGTFDLIKGIGTHQGYLTKTWSDGTTRTSRFEGRSKPEGKLRLSEGTWMLVGGTGRFEGIKGEGTYKATRYPNKMTVTDWKGKRVLPD
jgi:hypothetical protein